MNTFKDQYLANPQKLKYLPVKQYEELAKDFGVTTPVLKVEQTAQNVDELNKLQAIHEALKANYWSMDGDAFKKFK